MKYVLITPAHNEERFIPKTLESMVAQTLLPERWIIVDDGSTDRTAEILRSYAQALSMDPIRSRVRRALIGISPARFTRLTQDWSEFDRFSLK